VLPLPSLAWQLAQWSAKCAIPRATASAVGATGLGRFRSPAGMAMLLAMRAIRASTGPGVADARSPVIRA
jgi:hypothetical protein